MENVKKFYEALANDKELQAKAMALNEKYTGEKSDAAALEKFAEQELIPLAAAAGFPFTMEELKAYTEQLNVPQKLSDDELDAVAGGAYDKSKCFCAVGGGGEDISNNGKVWQVCACVLGGMGLNDEYNGYLTCVIAGTVIYL